MEYSVFAFVKGFLCLTITIAFQSEIINIEQMTPGELVYCEHYVFSSSIRCTLLTLIRFINKMQAIYSLLWCMPICFDTRTCNVNKKNKYEYGVNIDFLCVFVRNCDECCEFKEQSGVFSASWCKYMRRIFCIQPVPNQAVSGPWGKIHLWPPVACGGGLWTSKSKVTTQKMILNSAKRPCTFHENP